MKILPVKVDFEQNFSKVVDEIRAKTSRSYEFHERTLRVYPQGDDLHTKTRGTHIRYILARVQGRLSGMPTEIHI